MARRVGQPLAVLACATGVACTEPIAFVVASAPNQRSRGTEEPPCFREDARTIRDALGPATASILTLATPDDLVALRERVESAANGVTVALQAHGLPQEESTLDGSGVAVDGGAILLRGLFNAPRFDQVSWMVVLAGGCSSSWVDLRATQVPSSLVSFAVEPLVAYCGVVPVDCGGGASPLAEAVAEALRGAADRNGDCLVTDVELAEAVNTALRDCAPRSGIERKPLLRVAHQANGQIPVRLLPECAIKAEGTFERMLCLGQTLGGEIEANLRRQVAIARGDVGDLPETSFDYYLTDGSVPGLEAIAELHGLRPFPGNRREAELVAHFSTSIVVYVLSRHGNKLCVRQLPESTSSERCNPLRSEEPLESLRDALPSRAKIEAVFPDETRLKVSFRGRVPRGRFVAGDFHFSLDGARPSTCRLHGQCFEVAYQGLPVAAETPVWRTLQ